MLSPDRDALGDDSLWGPPPSTNGPPLQKNGTATATETVQSTTNGGFTAEADLWSSPPAVSSHLNPSSGREAGADAVQSPSLDAYFDNDLSERPAHNHNQSAPQHGLPQGSPQYNQPTAVQPHPAGGGETETGFFVPASAGVPPADALQAERVAALVVAALGPKFEILETKFGEMQERFEGRFQEVSQKVGTLETALSSLSLAVQRTHSSPPVQSSHAQPHYHGGVAVSVTTGGGHGHTAPGGGPTAGSRGHIARPPGYVRDGEQHHLTQGTRHPPGSHVPHGGSSAADNAGGGGHGEFPHSHAAAEAEKRRKEEEARRADEARRAAEEAARLRKEREERERKKKEEEEKRLAEERRREEERRQKLREIEARRREVIGTLTGASGAKGKGGAGLFGDDSGDEGKKGRGLFDD
uniref:Uncharacterized protein n=1 Tax=Chromera velia CCMP2878 TaxID=1169474 RepID=A0A0G4GSY7_9ALVE|eukprot:Cvel_23269.t1-p1 / transcript=Cvel_23269.t1 / gene=Cvel_23269 / organism=Chromera_velia_CCMP2878 / gene_product=hypothetical protein / transcript_product=hypothetical protein / location=Cvel_scaffold2379:5621-8320(+) / protein_length=411 / sequence_SO=supercontig / SO=protein_coding / is_pseudo=false